MSVYVRIGVECLNSSRHFISGHQFPLMLMQRLLSCCMLISVGMGVETAKSHRKCRRGQDMFSLIHKIKPWLASGKTATHEQYPNARTAKCLSRVRFTCLNVDDSCHFRCLRKFHLISSCRSPTTRDTK